MPFGSASPVAVNGALFQAGFRVFGLQANTAVFGANIGVPSAQSTISLIRPGNGDIIYAREAGGNGANIGTAGPIINGRDQSTAFPNNSLVHFYTISDGFTATHAIASLSPPFSPPSGAGTLITRNIGTMLQGPTLPTGYLYWNYAGCIPMNGANLYEGIYEHDWFQFRVPPVLLNSAAANGTFNLPTGMLQYGVEAVEMNLIAGLTTNGLGVAASTLTFDNFAFGTVYQSTVTVPAILQGVNDSAQFKLYAHTFPAMGTNYAYAWINDVNAANIAARSALINLSAFRSAFSLKG